jgi:hypothetical protein
MAEGLATIAPRVRALVVGLTVRRLVVMIYDARMRLRSMAVVCGLLASPSLNAQQSASGPAQIMQRLDNEQVRVIVATLQPHAPSIARTGHATNRVLIFLDDGAMTREEAGNATRMEFRRGDVRWRPASGAYTSENVSDHPIRILEVDLKGPPKVPPPATLLDPVAVDSTHFKVLLENEYVRVLRVHYGPREMSKNHEHLLNRVILYLNDHTDVKADDVRMGVPRIHVEENASDRPLDAIAVELK